MAEFDRFSSNYEQVLSESLVIGGGEPEFFHRGKALLIRNVLGSDFSGDLLDFGCGTGGLLRKLAEFLPAAALYGYDPSEPCIQRAASIPGVRQATSSETALSAASADVVLIANVLHHIVPEERNDVLRRVWNYLRPGGKVIVFEHNPYNPLTRDVVRRCPFDEGVVLLRPAEVKRRLRATGAVRVEQRYTTFFPSWVRALQPLERHMGWLPLGAQTCSVGHKRR
ncbi:MAG TPA: class I SAM-dependent methyltransferase [Longimicrobiales bacterium]|nr:class I SAM-dependent methyltransferase [Longimicrobiales bacterium]